jgi:diaminopimelate decarboxylase
VEGSGVPYSLDGVDINFSEVHQTLCHIKEKFNLKTIWMELGRYTVANCGYYITKIIDIKEVRGKKLVVTEGGINHAARVALTGQSFPCHALYQDKNDATEKYQVHGPLCTALDHLGDFDLPRNLKIGDRLVFNKAGAYGFTESMPYFLCHELPAEVISYNGDLMIPRPPKTALIG